ncbi:hypothetical protein SAMN04488122_4286 [Chitinophaga arvensicola]|uniref:Aspartyl protease n=2 Tax=Chitinophaga arvensicola TaxID=29529 RepID=A0A1I0S933_9BACT|nr:hypothetical protein SAMN04488122_4286 [Chitinophaga arvensicola]
MSFKCLFSVAIILTFFSVSAIPPGGPEISQPTPLNLLMVKDGGYTDRLLLGITQLGLKKVELKTVFDTGSEGLVLDAKAVLPGEMVTPDGIDLRGRRVMTLDGITITAIKDSTSYGDAPNNRMYYGQIAYTTVTLGDNTHEVTTRQMPVFLIYRGVKLLTGEEAAIDHDSIVNGICGVENVHPLSEEVATARKYMKSPFAYLNYRRGVYAGIQLSATGSADHPQVVSQHNNRVICAAPLLQVGLTNSMEDGYILQQKKMKNNSHVLSPMVVGKLRINGMETTGDILFDSGTKRGGSIADMNSFSDNSYVLDDQTQVSFTAREGFRYSFVADKKNRKITMVPNNTDRLKRSVWGLWFFINNNFIIDYSNYLIGIKPV